mmetsp:Transcript_115423/g.333404  ORF Transcript_115423/g.333404 Transcript_115423/m.333404 type:complete len:84 (+) Transcript_115423:29-280(+)
MKLRELDGRRRHYLLMRIFTILTLGLLQALLLETKKVKFKKMSQLAPNPPNPKCKGKLTTLQKVHLHFQTKVQKTHTIVKVPM